MWFFAMPLAERIKYQTCRENDCNETGIFSPDSCRSWYCGKHMEENFERQNYSIQVTDAIESWGLSFVQGNIIKYIVRAGRKTANPSDDLNKALWYLERELSKYGRSKEKDSSKHDKQNRKPKLKAKSTSTLSRKSRNLAKSNGGVRITTQAL